MLAQPLPTCVRKRRTSALAEGTPIPAQDLGTPIPARVRAYMTIAGVELRIRVKAAPRIRVRRLRLMCVLDLGRATHAPGEEQIRVPRAEVMTVPTTQQMLAPVLAAAIRALTRVMIVPEQEPPTAALQVVRTHAQGRAAIPARWEPRTSVGEVARKTTATKVHRMPRAAIVARPTPVVVLGLATAVRVLEPLTRIPALAPVLRTQQLAGIRITIVAPEVPIILATRELMGTESCR